MRYLNSLSSKIARRNRREHGLSLVELLVAMIIFAVIAAATVSIIVVLNNSAAKFQNTTATQNELNIAMNTIQRDISQANSVTVGAKYDLALTSIQKDVTYKTYIFYYDGTSDNVPDGASSANLPRSTKTRGAIIEQVFNGTTLQSQNILVGGYQPSNSWNSFFQYFTGNGTQLGSSGNTLTGDQLAQVARIQFNLQSKVSDRTTPVELSSAAALNSYDTGLTCNNCNPPIPAAPSLHGNLTYDSVTSDSGVHANLNWNQPGGTDSYTIYRTHGTQTIVVTTILQPETTSYVDSNNLVYGETYVYYIVANGASGLSAQSNTVSLTVRPPTGIIVNMNTTASLSQTKADNSAESGTTNPYGGLKYTVARDLTNQITWAPANGAVGYYVYRSGTPDPIATLNGINNTSYQDSYSTSNPAVYYGNTNTYYVIAYNVGENGSGGNGVKSNNAQLIGPPTAPIISGTAYNQTTGTPYNTINTTSPGNAGPDGSTVAGNHLYYTTVNGGAAATPTTATTRATANDFDRNGPTQHTIPSPGFGTATNYVARAYNDAGESPNSNPVLLEVNPGAFQITNIQTTASLTASSNGYLYTVARGLTNQISWTNSAGANLYDVYRGNTRIATGLTGNSYQDTNRSYGEVETYHVIARSTWGGDELDTRSTNDATLVSPPVGPTISGSAYGSTSGNPYNTLTLTNTVSNSNGYYLYRASSTSNVGDCGGANNTGQDFGTNQGSQLNDNVSFGSSTCYYAQSYNDAGLGQTSNQVTLFVGPSAFQIVNTNPSAQLGDVTNGSYNTVARGYTNQVAWNTSAGADSYSVNRGNNNIGSTAYNGGVYQDANRSAGEVETYGVTATSSWSGTSYTISVNSDNNATLQSPPLPPSLGTSANDSATNSNNSSNNVNITGVPGGSSANGYNLYYSTNQGTSITCSNVNTGTGTIGTSNGSSTTRSALWGSNTCYKVVGYNAAGNGPDSGAVSVSQKPNYFSLSDLSDSQHYLNIDSTKTSTTSCKGSIDSVDYCYTKSGDEGDGAVEHITSGSDSHHNGVSIPLKYNINWNSSYGVGDDGSKAAYSLGYTNNHCNKIISRSNHGDGDWDSGAGDSTSSTYHTTTSDTTYWGETYLTPGCEYTVTITAAANNGKTRSTSGSFVTAPTVAASADNYILTVASGAVRRLQTITTNVHYGYNGSAATLTFYNQNYFNGESTSSTESDTYDGDNSLLYNWSTAHSAAPLSSTAYVWTTTSLDGMSNTSIKVNFTGNVASTGCVPNTDAGYSTCASQWGAESSPSKQLFYPEGQYTDNYHPGYDSLD